MLQGEAVPFGRRRAVENIRPSLFVATENNDASSYTSSVIGGIMGTTNGEAYHSNDECGFDSRGSQFGLSQYN